MRSNCCEFNFTFYCPINQPHLEDSVFPFQLHRLSSPLVALGGATTGYCSLQWMMRPRSQARSQERERATDGAPVPPSNLPCHLSAPYRRQISSARPLYPGIFLSLYSFGSSSMAPGPGCASALSLEVAAAPLPSLAWALSAATKASTPLPCASASAPAAGSRPKLAKIEL